MIAAFPKMVMPFIVILPGIAALALTQMNVGYTLPVKGSGYDYDQALTTLMIHFYPSGLMGLLRRLTRPMIVRLNSKQLANGRDDAPDPRRAESS